MGTWRLYQFTIASGASYTNILPIAPCSKMTLIMSNMTGFMPGTGNTTIRVQADINSSAVNLNGNNNNFNSFGPEGDLTKSRIQTETVKGIYPLTFIGAPYMAIRFASGVTGTASNIVEVLTYYEVGS
jgi:hypothetical protein